MAFGSTFFHEVLTTDGSLLIAPGYLMDLKLIIFYSLIFQFHVQSLEWDYDGIHTGPANWSRIASPLCAGKQQSPIQIWPNDMKIALVPRDLSPFDFHNLDNLITDAVIENNGHSADPNSYMFYKGSLTTPPCTEDVSWVLFTHPMPVTIDELNSFRELHANRRREGEKWLQRNFRPTQPLYGRQVLFVQQDLHSYKKSNDATTYDKRFLNISIIFALLATYFNF
ncbi:carbonate dehydratase, eukaryotic-type [Trichinella nativa]|uniref:carbonic anhydrase n=1 Tax=Trichinella nativa TaxID=6335 RepID=A0A1Y3E6G9_9BILA|nr:carbonate dehydratase, eukaryotic-type [Trichinella nativa]